MNGELLQLFPKVAQRANLLRLFTAFEKYASQALETLRDMKNLKVLGVNVSAKTQSTLFWMFQNMRAFMNKEALDRIYVDNDDINELASSYSTDPARAADKLNKLLTKVRFVLNKEIAKLEE